MSEEPAEPFERDDTRAIIETARRRHGTLGAAIAAGMLGLDKLMGRRPREEAPIVMAAPSEPVDIDHEGIVVPVDDEFSVFAPAQPRPDPYARRRSRRPRRR